MKGVDRERRGEAWATSIRAMASTHSGCNIKVEDGGSGSLHVVLEKLHHCVRGDLRAMDGNSHMSGVHKCVFCQLISHPCNEEGLPHARSCGADNPYTGAVCVCVFECVGENISLSKPLIYCDKNALLFTVHHGG